MDFGVFIYRDCLFCCVLQNNNNNKVTLSAELLTVGQDWDRQRHRMREVHLNTKQVRSHTDLTPEKSHLRACPCHLTSADCNSDPRSASDETKNCFSESHPDPPPGANQQTDENAHMSDKRKAPHRLHSCCIRPSDARCLRSLWLLESSQNQLVFQISWGGRC